MGNYRGNNRSETSFSILGANYAILLFKNQVELIGLPHRYGKYDDVLDLLNDKENNTLSSKGRERIIGQVAHIIKEESGNYSYDQDFIKDISIITSTGLTKEESCDYLLDFHNEKKDNLVNRNFNTERGKKFLHYIDLDKVQLGRDAFENKQYYRKSIEEAQVYFTQNFDKEITPAMFIHIHTLATGKVTGIFQERVVATRKGVNPFSGYDLEFINNQNPSSIEGFKELSKIKINGKPLIIIDSVEDESAFNEILNAENKPAHCIISRAKFRKDPQFRENEFLSVYRVYTLRSPKESKEAMSEILENYNSRIFDLKNDLDKIRLIADTCRQLEVSHFFGDGNHRATIFILMNKMLADMGLTPAILKDPCIFDGQLTLAALTDNVIEGMALYREATNIDFDTRKKYPKSKISSEASKRIDRLIKRCKKSKKSSITNNRIKQLVSMKKGSYLNRMIDGFQLDRQKKFKVTMINEHRKKNDLEPTSNEATQKLRNLMARHFRL